MAKQPRGGRQARSSPPPPLLPHPRAKEICSSSPAPTPIFLPDSPQRVPCAFSAARTVWRRAARALWGTACAGEKVRGRSCPTGCAARGLPTHAHVSHRTQARWGAGTRHAGTRVSRTDTTASATAPSAASTAATSSQSAARSVPRAALSAPAVSAARAGARLAGVGRTEWGKGGRGAAAARQGRSGRRPPRGDDACGIAAPARTPARGRTPCACCCGSC